MFQVLSWIDASNRVVTRVYPAADAWLARRRIYSKGLTPLIDVRVRNLRHAALVVARLNSKE